MGCLRVWLRKRVVWRSPASVFMQPKHLKWVPMLRPQAWVVRMLFILTINKLAEMTMFMNSGNPNHQIFMLQVCSISFDV